MQAGWNTDWTDVMDGTDQSEKLIRENPPNLPHPRSIQPADATAIPFLVENFMTLI